MALVSDIDWVILAAVAVFLLLGRGAGDVMRAMGRYYGRAVRLKNELLAEVTKSAGLPAGASLRPTSIRHTLLGDDATLGGPSQVPLAVSVPPSTPPIAYSATTGMGGSLGAPAWTVSESVPAPFSRSPP
jgi:hypothetical protein